MEIMPVLFFGKITGESLVDAIVWLVIAAAIFWLLNWAIKEIAPPEPWNKVAKVIIVIATVVVLINVLLTLVGKPLINI